MPSSCSAYGCSNYYLKTNSKNRNVSYYTFPLKNEHLLKEWLAAMKRLDFHPKENTRICSDHFSSDCFEVNPISNKRSLKEDAIPTIFNFSETKNLRKRKRTLYTIGDSNEAGTSYDSNSTTAQPDSQSFQLEAGSQTEVGFDLLIDEMVILNEELAFLRDEKNAFLNPEAMKDDELKALTGFNKEIFLKIFRFLNISEDLNSEKFSALQEFLIFMLKLRTGITLTFLAYLFKVNASTISRSFNNTVDLIYFKLKGLGIWPTKEQLEEYMPFEFKAKYPNCRVIVDCTEIFVQKPSNPKEQQLTFSSYKNQNTAKALIGIAPSGSVCFISDLWCGSVSDKHLFLNSGLPELLKPQDLVLADKGFTIGNELKNLGCCLATPLFLKDRIQFSLEERGYNKKVSHLRIHVERAISRIKIFKYFEGCIPYNSLHNLNEVFYITAFLTNFNNPLIRVEAKI